jgi:hypothetical protein
MPDAVEIRGIAPPDGQFDRAGNVNYMPAENVYMPAEKLYMPAKKPRRHVINVVRHVINVGSGAEKGAHTVFFSCLPAFHGFLCVSRPCGEL